MRISDWSSDVGSSDLRALDLATSEWVLSIDADERVPAELAGAIRRELDQPRADGYRIGHLSKFCGRWIRHSGWWPDRVLQLGSASCRERVCQYVSRSVVAESFKKKKQTPHIHL